MYPVPAACWPLRRLTALPLALWLGCGAPAERVTIQVFGTSCDAAALQVWVDIDDGGPQATLWPLQDCVDSARLEVATQGSTSELAVAVKALDKSGCSLATAIITNTQLHSGSLVQVTLIKDGGIQSNGCTKKGPIWIDSMAPQRVKTMRPSDLTLTGWGFSRRSVVYVDGTAVPAERTSISALVAHLPPTLAPWGTVPLEVVNPGELGSGQATSKITFTPGNLLFTSAPQSLEGTIPESAPASQWHRPQSLAVADFDRDGRLDVVVAVHDALVFLPNQPGERQFWPRQRMIDLGSPAASGIDAVVAVDLNQDGAPDLVFTDSGNDLVRVALNHGDGTFALPVNHPSSGGPSLIAVGDYNGDGRSDDLAVAHRDLGGVTVFLNLGGGRLDAASQLAAGVIPLSLAAGEFDADRLTDLALTQSGEEQILLFRNLGSRRFADPFPQKVIAHEAPVGGRPYMLVAGDFDEDGGDDLVVSYPYEGKLGFLKHPMLFGDGDAVVINTRDHRYLAAGDFDGDHLLDLMTTGNAFDGLSLHLNGGNGSFDGEPPFFPAGDHAGALAVGDFDGDRKLDVLSVNSARTNLYSLRNVSH